MICLQNDAVLSLSLCLFSCKVFIPYFCGSSFPYIVHFIASEPSIRTFQGNHLNACPIKTLRQVVERAMSCEITVQVSFSHKYDQFSWCSALNVNVVVTFPDICPFRCLHNSVVFPEILLSSVRSYWKYSQGVFTPRDPWLADQSTFSPQTPHS